MFYRFLPPYAFSVDDLWRCLPTQENLLRGIIGSDIIGFHTDEYMETSMVYVRYFCTFNPLFIG